MWRFVTYYTLSPQSALSIARFTCGNFELRRVGIFYCQVSGHVKAKAQVFKLILQTRLIAPQPERTPACGDIPTEQW